MLSSDIEDIQVHLNNKGKLDYYSLTISDASVDIEDNYSLDSVDADIYGTLRSGIVNIRNLSVNMKEKMYWMAYLEK